MSLLDDSSRVFRFASKRDFFVFFETKGSRLAWGECREGKKPIDGWQIGTVLAVTRELMLGRKKVALFSEK